MRSTDVTKGLKYTEPLSKWNSVCATIWPTVKPFHLGDCIKKDIGLQKEIRQMGNVKRYNKNTMKIIYHLINASVPIFHLENEGYINILWTSDKSV